MSVLRNEGCEFGIESAIGVKFNLLLLDEGVAILTVVSCRKVQKCRVRVLRKDRVM